MNIAQPFPIIAYQNNPVFLYISVPAQIELIPGLYAASFAVTSGTLPPGLSLNPTTGTISGTPTMLLSNSTVDITATFADTTTYTSAVIFNILNIPVEAPQSNAASQAGLVALAQYHTNIFINDVNAQIMNANALGKFQIYANVPSVCNFNTIVNYFEGLNYSVELVNWRANRYQLNSPWLGEFYNSGEFGGPYGGPFYNLTPPGYPLLQKNNNRIRLTWNPYPIGRYAPYYF